MRKLGKLLKSSKFLSFFLEAENGGDFDWDV